MKALTVLLKREWLEWHRVVIGTVLIVTFLNLLPALMLITTFLYFFIAEERI